MPKINQEEYEILKTMLSVGYEYIAREKEGHVIVFTAYHGKSEHRWMVTTNRVGLKCESLFNSNEVFQFIQWTDDEPYEIAELIREYEYTADYYASQLAKLSKVIYGNESEEKEVKDLKWAVKEIESLMTEESQSYPHDKMVEQEIVLGILKQLEVETLSQDWIDNHTDKFVGNEGHRFVSTNDLQNLLVPRQEEVDPDEARFNRKVNKIIKAIENPKRLKLRDVVEKMESLSEVNQKQWLDRLNEKFGEIEEEPKYYAKIKGWENVTTGSERFNWVYFKEKDTVGVSKAIENKYQAVSFTKDEWENLGINDDNADFVEVEEVEE